MEGQAGGGQQSVEELRARLPVEDWPEVAFLTADSFELPDADELYRGMLTARSPDSCHLFDRLVMPGL